jgi:flagellar biosynthesis protein FlhA
VVKVLQGLLAERISIRNLRSIFETLVECGARSQDPQVLIGQVRVALSRQIMQDICGRQELPVVTFDAGLEQMLTNTVAAGAATPGLEPGLAERLQQRLLEVAQRQEMSGQPAVLLVSPSAASRCLHASCARPCRRCTSSPGTKSPTAARCGPGQHDWNLR